MYKLISILLLSSLLVDACVGHSPIDLPGIFNRFLSYGRAGPYNLCTYTSEAFEKCQQTVSAAQSRSLDLPLQCVRKDTRSDCINAIRSHLADITVLTGHNYEAARNAGLKPAIFARDNEEDFYIAVAPRDITVVAVDEVPVIVNQSNHRAYHAAIYFNLRRGHDVCRLFNQASDGNYVKIVNSREYTPNDEEILLCPDRSWAFPESFRECNFEAGLQRAVFVKNHVPLNVISDLKRRVFDVIAREFRPIGENKNGGEDFNFFGTFHGKDNVIFKNNAIGFDLHPTYRNGVTEEVSSQFHCNQDIGNHDSSQLE